MSVLEGLLPINVFKYFEEICAIPHGSGSTKQISDYCVDFAKKNNLEYYRDEVNNVIIKKKASKGFEDRNTVVLQGHLDMVCEKAPDCNIDMTSEGLKLAVDGDFVHAVGTTLGADDGIAVAICLAILADERIEHPKLEAVFTVDEETGMIGAGLLDGTKISGRTMINIDSEDEGVFTVSCAGGNISKCILPVTREKFDGKCLEICISGLAGGHSGGEINKGRANSNVLLGRILYRLGKVGEIRVASVCGGLKDNAIPNKSTAVIFTDDEKSVRDEFKRAFADIKNEYSTAEKNMEMTITETKSHMLPMDKVSTDNTVTMLLCLPNGIQEMSMDIEGLVQTSLNLGILLTDENTVSASFCVRSSIESQKHMLTDRLCAFMKIIGGIVEVSGEYPGWAFNKNSKLLDVMCDVFAEQYGRQAKVEAIHAGVECGLFSGKLPGLDCVSIGPDLFEIHTFREKMSISSVQRVWKFLLEVLKRL